MPGFKSASIGSPEELRLFRSILQANSGSRGFTLVESLVALTVMMILLSAIGALSASSLRAGRYVENHVADIDNFQKILAGLPGRSELANLPRSGEMAGYRWRLDGKPYNADFVDARAQIPWAPETIVMTVQGPSGARLSFDMIRLVRAGAK
jgi:prepilin-type N-terminal cleavage/methylation domain-containing protein